jgi:hypothetical protein
MDTGIAFVTSLAAGQILGQQLRYGGGGNNLSLGPPKQHAMDAQRGAKVGLPTCPMVYAVITDMNAFGNPKVDNDHYIQYPPTYPADVPPLPALVPLTLDQMNLTVDCHISTGFTTMQSAWDVNCVRSRTFCDCLLVIPMDNQVCSKFHHQYPSVVEIKANLSLTLDFMCVGGGGGARVQFQVWRLTWAMVDFTLQQWCLGMKLPAMAPEGAQTEKLVTLALTTPSFSGSTSLR